MGPDLMFTQELTTFQEWISDVPCPCGRCAICRVLCRILTYTDMTYLLWL